MVSSSPDAPPLPAAKNRLRSGTPWVVAALLLLPVVTYWPTVMHRFGFRDDYPLLREAQLQPGKIFAVCAAQGRIFYGLILEATMAFAGGIDGLRWIRLFSAVGLGILGAVLFVLFVRMGWRKPFAALLASALVLMPPAQVVVSWATCAPQVVALLLATAAFAAANWVMATPEGTRVLRQLGTWLLAVVLLGTAALTYQSNALFYLVLVGAHLVVRRNETLKVSLRWLIGHAITSGVGLAFAFLTMKLTFALEWFRPSTRIRFEQHWLAKFEWLITQILPDALAQPVVGGGPEGWETAHSLLLLGALTLLAAGLVLEWRKKKLGAVRWAIGFVTLPVGTFIVNLLAAERWPSYRGILPLAAVCSVFLIASLANVVGFALGEGRRMVAVAVAGVVLAGSSFARWQTYEFFAMPQGHELALMSEGADQVATLTQAPWVYVITAHQWDSPAPYHYRDEFGSVSMDAGWIVTDVLALLIQEREKRPANRLKPSKYSLTAGPISPVRYVYDVVIDLRRIAKFRRK